MWWAEQPHTPTRVRSETLGVTFLGMRIFAQAADLRLSDEILPHYLGGP